MIGKKVIVRGDRSGVFFGTLESVNERTVKLSKVRNIWYWNGAASIMQIANEGVKDKEGSKLTVVVESLVLLDVVQIIPCTNEAITNIESVREWKI